MPSPTVPPPVELFAVRNVRGGPWDWSRGMREQPGWKQHAAFMNGLVDEGFILLGGPLQGDREILLICAAASPEEVRRRLAADPWAASGMIAVDQVQRWTIVLSPPALDTILESVPRPTPPPPGDRRAGQG